MLFFILLILLYIPLLIVYPCRVIGKKNLPKSGRVIFGCNHQTVNDPILIAYKLAGRRRFKFMAKAPLFENKIFGALLKGLGAYPVHPSSSDITSVKTTMKHLKDEKAVCIFPEGARLVSSEENQLKHGVAMFALKTQTPVVPAYFVKKTNAFVPNTMLIGEPIELHNMEQFKDVKIDKDVLEEASNIIKDSMRKLYNDYMAEKFAKKHAKEVKRNAKKNTK